MHRGWFKQRIVLSGAWSVPVPSARVAGSLCSVCKLSGGCSVPWAFGKGREVSRCPQAEAPLEEADPGCVMSSRGLWPCRGGWYPASCWCSDPVVRAHPETGSAHRLLPFAFSCAAPPACATKPTVFCPQPPFPAISTLLFLSLSRLLPFPPLLFNLYFFFSVPAKRYQSR